MGWSPFLSLSVCQIPSTTSLGYLKNRFYQPFIESRGKDV